MTPRFLGIDLYEDGKPPIALRYIFFALATAAGLAFALITQAVRLNLDNIIQLFLVWVALIILFVPLYLVVERQVFARLFGSLPQFWPPVFTFCLWVVLLSGLAILDRPSKLKNLSRFVRYMQRVHMGKEVLFFFHLPSLIYVGACIALWYIWPPDHANKIKPPTHSDILDDNL